MLYNYNNFVSQNSTFSLLFFFLYCILYIPKTFFCHLQVAIGQEISHLKYIIYIFRTHFEKGMVLVNMLLVCYAIFRNTS